MTRTDVHRPSALVPEDYEYAYGYDAHPDCMNASYVQAQVERLREEGYRFGGPEGRGCQHCGANIRYVAVLKHVPTKTLIRVGETCLARFDLTTDEFHALRKAAALDRQKQRIKNRRLAFFAQYPDAETAYGWASERVAAGEYGWEGTRHNYVSRINREGDASQRFTALILRDMVRTEQREAERAEQDATRTAVVEGDGVTITGKVVSVKFKEDGYGGRMVWTVEDDRGFLVWGSVPRSVDPERGDRVRFKANVTRSDRDESFGFAKRPRAAVNLTADADGPALAVAA